MKRTTHSLPLTVIPLYHHYGKISIGKLHKDFDLKIVETVHYAEYCPGAAAHGQPKRKNEMKKWGYGKTPRSRPRSRQHYSEFSTRKSEVNLPFGVGDFDLGEFGKTLIVGVHKSRVEQSN